MNVYDQAHGLAAAIKNSEEFKEFKRYDEQVKANPSLEKMIRDMEQKSVEFQTKQMMGENVTEEMMQNMTQLYQIVMQDPVAAQYMQASMRFSIMMKDVYEILGEATGMGGLDSLLGK